MIYKNKSGDILDDDLQVLAEIYNMTIIKKEPCWFSKLVKYMSVSSTTISRVQDRAYDIGLLDMEYEKVGELWTYCWKLSDHGEFLIRRICGNIQEQEVK